MVVGLVLCQEAKHQFVGNPPIQATIHETQKLRCNACLTYFEASLDKELKQRYHPSSDVSIALQHYSLGLPFYRLGQWQILSWGSPSSQHSMGPV